MGFSFQQELGGGQTVTLYLRIKTLTFEVQTGELKVVLGAWLDREAARQGVTELPWWGQEIRLPWEESKLRRQDIYPALRPTLAEAGPVTDVLEPGQEGCNGDG